PLLRPSWQRSQQRASWMCAGTSSWASFRSTAPSSPRDSIRIENPVRVEALLQAPVDAGNGRLQRMKASVAGRTTPAQSRAPDTGSDFAYVDVGHLTSIPTQRATPVDQRLARQIQRRRGGGHRQTPDRILIEEWMPAMAHGVPPFLGRCHLD